ncbi:PDZ domain-containing protein [Bremerella sp. P1]|uniref:PDZ domain-containing protein n=1 Tax=Bremerella sp. P1 TaxID=3026424 RepID=UPI00236819C8|nr:PDZ domain-containing protein [Bremerella sp. P1]WDI42747.1 PDZ domain-containing protein [Bremerella sp. P1]
MTRCRTLSLLGCLIWGGMMLAPAAYGAEPSEGAPAKQPPTSAEITSWIDQLDSDKFLLRENATQKLIGAHQAAIGPLADAVRSGSLEKAFRCIHVLRAFAIGDDIETEIEASAKLALVAATENDRVGAYAGDVLKRIEPLQRERAIRILSGLGVKFTSYAPQQGFQTLDEGPGIWITNDYTGSAKELHYLQHLGFIEDVQIENDKITADWFAEIAKMPNVHLMTIKDGPVDIEMLRELEPIMHKIDWLRLYYLNLKSSPAPLLKKMTSLHHVEMFGMVVDGKEVFKDVAEQERIRSALPGVLPDGLKFRSGGFLGVRGPSDGNRGPCVVQSVDQDTGAYKAGLRGGDTVVEVNGVKVQGFMHLIELLQDKKAGDKVKMIAVRGTETKELDVTLGKWQLREIY